MQKNLYFISFFLLLVSGLAAQSVTPWLTRGDQSVLLAQQSSVSFNTNTASTSNTITLQSGTLQSVDGFGFMLTQASAQVIAGMSNSKQNQLLQELFGSNGLSISALRISIGASDLGSSLYTYNEVSGDTNMNNFSLNGPDKTYLIPILKKILAINPNIKILATPWTAPTWMKTNNSWIGGSLRTNRYGAYARYFVKYLEAMDAEGIAIWAITPQNEPGNGSNEPSMEMTASQQITFINDHLGPQIANSPYNPKIIAYDHNCDNTTFPIQVLNGSSYVDGAAFHLYAGNISAMSTVRNATGKNVYFTEQYTGSNGDFSGDLSWHMRNVVTGSLNNWSKTVFEWNLAADSNNGPRTAGGCSDCLPAITVSNANNYNRNLSYYIIGHLSKFIKPGARRINSSNNNGQLYSTAFQNPDGQRIVVAYNDAGSSRTVRVIDGNKAFNYTLSRKSAVTFVWTPSGNQVLGGYYNIISRRSNKGLDVGNYSFSENANVQQYQISNGGGDNQRWEFIDAGSGYYRIKVKHSGKCLTQRSTSSDNVVQQNCSSTNNLQKWKLIDVGSGHFSLQNKSSSRRLHVSSNSTSNGANIQVFTNNNNTNQQWRFVQVETNTNRLATENTKEATGSHNESWNNNPASGEPAVSYSVEPSEIEMSNAEELRIFPNPSAQYVNIVLPVQHTYSKVLLIDPMGRQLVEVSIDPATKNLELDVEKLPAGVYHIQFYAPDGGHTVRKLIKN